MQGKQIVNILQVYNHYIHMTIVADALAYLPLVLQVSIKILSKELWVLGKVLGVFLHFTFYNQQQYGFRFLRCLEIQSPRVMSIIRSNRTVQ